MDLDNLDSGRNTNSLDTIYSNLYGKVDNNDLNVYLVPANILIYYNGLDGLASHATKPPPECNNCGHLESNEYSWYFQVPARMQQQNTLPESFDSKELEQDTVEYTIVHDVCLNRAITIEKDCSLISLTRSVCGNGVVEANEQCGIPRIPVQHTKNRFLALVLNTGYSGTYKVLRFT